MSFRPLRFDRHKIQEIGNTPPEPFKPEPQPLSQPRVEPDPEPEAPQIPEDLLASIREEALAAARAELDEQRAALARSADTLAVAIEQAKAARYDALTRASGEIGEMILAFSHRILDRSLALNPGALEHLIRSTIEQLPDHEEVTLAVAPDVADMAVELLGERCRVVPDPQIRTGCMVRTRTVAMDATLEAALEELEQAIRTWLAEQPAGMPP